MFNQGTFIFLIALAGSVLLLFIFVLLIGIIGKKKQKGAGLAVLKMFSLLFVIITIGLSVTSTLAYYNYLPVNIRYGRYISVDGTKTYLKINRHSCEIHKNGSSEGIDGRWTLEENQLKIRYDGTQDTYSMGDFGTKIYRDGELVYKYVKN